MAQKGLSLPERKEQLSVVEKKTRRPYQVGGEHARLPFPSKNTKFLRNTANDYIPSHFSSDADDGAPEGRAVSAAMG